MNPINVKAHTSGSGLILVIAIIALISLLTGIMISRYVARVSSIRMLAKEYQDLYTAESGIKYALHHMKQEENNVIDWRTGDHFEDKPLKAKIFVRHDDMAAISIKDDCGYLLIKSRAENGQAIEISALGTMPDELSANLCLVSEKPVVLYAGSQVKGRAILNHEPVYYGGTIEGLLETRSDLSMPSIHCRTFENSIDYYRYLLSTPQACDTELFSAQVFSPSNVFPRRSIYINDAAIIENSEHNSFWLAGKNIMLVSTAQVQVSGGTRISGFSLVAIGSIEILDNAIVQNARIFSASRIEISDNAQFSGALVAPEIVITGNARLNDPSVIYCGEPLKEGRISFSGSAVQHCSVINTCPGEKSLIEISAEAEINGFIFSTAPVSLHGGINGHLFCHGFQEIPVTANTSNHNIIMGRIEPPAGDRAKLSIPLMFSCIKDLRVVEWREY